MEIQEGVSRTPCVELHRVRVQTATSFSELNELGQQRLSSIV